MQLFYLTVFLSFTIPVQSHCMLDMRLDFENNADTMLSIQKIAIEKINSLKEINNSNSYQSSSYDILRSMTMNYHPALLSKRIQEKTNETMFNVEQIIKNYCLPMHSDMKLSQEISSRDEYPSFKTKCNIKSNNIQYSEDGKFDVVVKKMAMKQFVGFSKEMSKAIVLSRVATLVRARECLLNVQAYNVTNVKFQEIQNSIKTRTSALSALLQKVTNKEVMLDSVPPLDCRFFTPHPENPSSGIGKILPSSVFYMSYPDLTANLEELFFFKSDLLTTFLNSNENIQNDLNFRLQIVEKMLTSLISLHQTGIIHKNIRLSNISYYYFNEGQHLPPKIIISFGDFSLSGIDDYDTKLAKNFFVPDDALTELGPMLDVYQLGIAIVQILYMIPSAATPEMTLSKIAKMTDEDTFISYGPDKKRVHLFEQLMYDGMYGISDWTQYSSAMRPQPALCSVLIFQKIYKYFSNRLWDNYSAEDRDLIVAMYWFQPGPNDDLTYNTLYKLPKFKANFMSMFLNLYGLTPECYGENALPQDLLIIIRGMLNPDQSIRMNLSSALERVQEYNSSISTSDNFKNKIYGFFDSTSFKGKDYNSVLKRKQTANMII